MKYFDSILSFLVAIAHLICSPRAKKCSNPLPDDPGDSSAGDGREGSCNCSSGGVTDADGQASPASLNPPEGEKSAASFIVGCLLMIVGSVGWLLRYV